MIISDGAIGVSTTSKKKTIDCGFSKSNGVYTQDDKIAKRRKPGPGGSNLMHNRHRNRRWSWTTQLYTFRVQNFDIRFPVLDLRYKVKKKLYAFLPGFPLMHTVLRGLRPPERSLPLEFLFTTIWLASKAGDHMIRKAADVHRYTLHVTIVLTLCSAALIWQSESRTRPLVLGSRIVAWPNWLLDKLLSLSQRGIWIMSWKTIH